MLIRSDFASHKAALSQLFQETFAASEGPEEGRVIGEFVSKLLETTPNEDLFVFFAEAESLQGAICFSRIRYPEEPRSVFILSPVAIAPHAQRQGLGQRLISAGLETLRAEGVDFALTYGDPAYYIRTGFEPISEAFAAAPQPLSMPIGWLGQPLAQAGQAPFKGKPTCAPALDDPALW